MGNKYTWVLFNLVASISLLALFLNGDHSAITGDAILFVLVIYISLGLWIYRTIIYWRKCIQADDPAFDKVVSELDEKSGCQQTQSNTD